MKYRAVTCYDKTCAYPNDVFFKVEGIPDEKLSQCKLASPPFEFSSEEEVIKSLDASRLKLVLLSGEVIIPFEENYPDLWKNEILKPWHPGVIEIWPRDE